MNKVSWPSRGELFRASVVVIVVIFFLAAILFAYDLVLTSHLRAGVERLVQLDVRLAVDSDACRQARIHPHGG